MHIQPRPVSPPRNKAALPLAVCGCMAVVLVIVVFAGFRAFRSGSTSVKQAGDGADHFLSGLERQDYQTAFNFFTAQTRKGRTIEDITDAMEVLAKRHGRPVSHRQLPGFYVNTFNGVTSVSLTYQETFEKGEMPVKIDLIAENGQWHVQGFGFHP